MQAVPSVPAGTLQLTALVKNIGRTVDPLVTATGAEQLVAVPPGPSSPYL